MNKINKMIKSKEDLTKQLKFREIIEVNGIDPILIEGKKDKEIEIIEDINSLEMYKNREGVFSIMEHIKTGEKQPYTVGLLFGGGFKNIDIFSIKIVNYSNQCINLIITGVDKIGHFTHEKPFFPFHNKKDFEYLFNLYNQEKTNIYISNYGELINSRKMGNHLYLNEDLGNILMSIDENNFLDSLEELESHKNEIYGEITNNYQVNDFIEKLGNKNYIYLEKNI